MNLIDHYQLKWLPADLLFLIDTLANGMGAGEYHAFFEFFGIQPGTVNAAVSTLEIIRIGVLLYQRGVEREAQSTETSALDHKQDRTEDK